MGAKSSVAIGLTALLSIAPALAEEQAASCLPADLKLRVAFAEPKRVMEMLGDLSRERGDAGKRALLRQRETARLEHMPRQEKAGQPESIGGFAVRRRAGGIEQE